MLRKKPTCQSCSFPIHPSQHGTEADGSLNIDYCMGCYAEGWFTNPDMPMEEMQVVVVDVMRQKRRPKFIARAASKKVSELKRWA